MFQKTLLALSVMWCATGAFAAWEDNNLPDTTGPMKDATTLLSEEKFDEALVVLLKIDEDSPNEADVLNLIGYANRKIGNLDQSAIYYSRALDVAPNHLGALEYQAELFILQGDLPAAQANLARLEELCPLGCDELSTLQQALGGS
ncbi:MAG: hypothetical protein AAFQ64_15260 [Pseudomonadota bacterium]